MAGIDVVRLRFIYEAPVSEDAEELAEEALTEVMADFDGLAEVTLAVEGLAAQQRRTLQHDEVWVYLRREVATRRWPPTPARSGRRRC